MVSTPQHLVLFNEIMLCTPSILREICNILYHGVLISEFPRLETHTVILLEAEVNEILHTLIRERFGNRCLHKSGNLVFNPKSINVIDFKSISVIDFTLANLSA